MNCSVPEMLASAATHVDAGEFAQAEVLCNQLLAAEPQNPHVLHIQGVAARKQARYAEAAERLHRSLALEPRNAAVAFELGVLHIDQKQWSEALPHFRRALELNPDNHAACVNIATLLERMDQVEEALPWARRALQMNPDCVTAHFNLANTLQAVGLLDEAIRAFDATLQRKPDFENARWNASLARLLSGDFAAGWPMYEARQTAGKVTIDRYPQPRWQGESLSGKTIVVHGEQGIGDELLFASCLPDLTALGGTVVVVCDPRLESLFARSFPAIKMHGIARRKDGAPADVPGPIDYQIPIGSLPGFFRTSRAAFPRRWRYLHADADARETWRARFDELGSGLKVGISWRAGGQPLERRKRTTTLAQWLPLLEQPGVRFVNLQYGDASEEMESARRDLGVTLHDFADGDPLCDMDTFAAKLSALDLVISVGNATVHLAGALGVPAWSLLPRVPGWRWMLTGAQSLWYPSVRLFRQTARGQWDPVFAAAATALANRTGRTQTLRSSAEIQGNPQASPSPRHSECGSHHAEAASSPLTLADVTGTFPSAVELYHRQDYAAAERICQQILAHAPRDAKALHLHGLIARATGRLELAIRSIGLAIQIDGSNAQMHLHLAAAQIGANRLGDALASYGLALVSTSDTWSLHYEFGGLLRDAGHLDEAEQAFVRATECDPQNAKAHNALAGIYMETLRWPEAERSLRQAIALKPDYMAAFNNLGRCLHFQGRLAEAAEQLRRALQLDAHCQQAAENLRLVERERAHASQASTPSAASVESLALRAAQLYNQDRVEEATTLARQIIACDANHVIALRILGVAARQAGDLPQSQQLLERALQRATDDYALHFELGVTLTALHETRAALTHHQRALALRPTFQPACINISAIYEEQERYEDVVAWTQRSLALKPECALSHYNLANALRELGRIEEALVAYQRSQELDPTYQRAEWNRGLSHLLLGDYERGWPMFERRIELGEVTVDDYPQPRWDGSSLAGKSILIHAEQGIGDEVLFASCFDEVISEARYCAIVCEPRLVALFRRSFPQATVYGHQRQKNRVGLPLKEVFDVQIPAGSLPLYLRKTRADFPTRDCLLRVDDRQLQFWRERFASLGPGLKIGISWRAGGKPQERRKRMIPLELWHGILTTPGVQFINLQYSDSSEEAAQVGQQLGIAIHDWEEGDPLVDMDSFAAKVQALDLVISVGNATVHIAGAVGTEAWTLLPMVPSWRWMVRGEQSPWYANVKLFRQPMRGDWHSVMDTLARRLRTRVGAKPPPANAATPLDASPEHTPGDDPWYQAKEVSADAMVESIGTSLADAERCILAGDLASAETHYREVLQIAPRHFQALHGLGGVARMTGRTELAIRSFQRSLAMVDTVATHHADYATALADAHRHKEAVAAYSRALELDPGLSLARVELGRLLQRLGQHQQALTHFDKAALPGGEDAGLLVDRGISLANQCCIDEAVVCFEQALRRNPAHVPALTALADVYLEDQQYEDAERCLRRAIALRADVATWHVLLGRVLRIQGEMDEAIVAVERAADLVPDDTALLLELGTLYRDAGDYERSIEILTRGAQIAPQNAELLDALGLVLASFGNVTEAIHHFDRALAVRPDRAASHVHRGFTLLAQGNLAEGWQAYEWRLKVPGIPRQPNVQIPGWRGESLADKTIVVYGEQGVGEELMFSSCYRDLIERARQVVIVCQPRLAALFRRSFPQAKVLPVTRGQEATWRIPTELHADFQIAAGSLPSHVRCERSRFDGRPFLQAERAKMASWQERFAALGNGLKVGIAWQEDRSDVGQRTSDNPLADWLPVLQTAGAQCVSLQAGDPRDALQQLALNHGIVVHHWQDTNSTADLDDLAARMATLDLVIAADAAAVHLAGGLGVPAWCLPPAADLWHWLAASHDDRCLWYPSVRLFRSCHLRKEGEPFGQVASELLNRTHPQAEEPKGSRTGIPHLRLGRTGTTLFGMTPVAGPDFR